MELLDEEIKFANKYGDGLELTVSILRTSEDNEKIKHLLDNGFEIEDVIIVEHYPKNEYEMILFSKSNS